MMREEWLALTKTGVITPEDWDAVNTVYAWHPGLPEGRDSARSKCLVLWMDHGYGIFHDMLPTAQKACDLDTAIRKDDIGWAITDAKYDRLIKALKHRKAKALGDIDTMRSYHEEALKTLKGRYKV